MVIGVIEIFQTFNFWLDFRKNKNKWFDKVISSGVNFNLVRNKKCITSLIQMISCLVLKVFKDQRQSQQG